MEYSNPNSIYNPFENRSPSSKQTYTQEQLDFLYEMTVVQGMSSRDFVDEFGGTTVSSINTRKRQGNWTASTRMQQLPRDTLELILNEIGTTSDEALAQKYHTSITTISRLKDGSYIPRAVQKLTEKQIAEMAAEHKRGATLEEIAERYCVSIESIIRLKTKNWQRQAKKKNKYCFNENYFDAVDTPQVAYWFGFLCADGYIQSKRKGKRENQAQAFGVTLSVTDFTHLEKLKEDLGAENPIKIYDNNGTFGKTKTCRLLLTSQHAVDSLISLGCIENKSLILKFPTKAQVPTSLLSHFIRGYFDGDGSISYTPSTKKWAMSFCGTFEFLMGIQEFFGTNVKLSQRFPERNNNAYNLAYGGNLQIKRLMTILYEDADRYLDRKFERYIELSKYGETQGI